MVRVVVLNYQGGEKVLRCLEHLASTDWPADRLELVVVDNASTDGSAEAIDRMAGVRLIRTTHNMGFPANNLAMVDLDEVDYVALVNNDAYVTPGWLRPLVEVLEEDPGLGAACPKILFEPSFVDVGLSCETFTAPGDPRRLGVRVSGVRVGGKDAWRSSQFTRGFWGPERGVGEEEVFRWTEGSATLRVPAPADGSEAVARLRVATSRPDVLLEVSCGRSTTTHHVGPQPTWVEFPLEGEPYDVIQNAGSILVEGGFGADRGFLERDSEVYDEPADVFAWCGAAVLLSSRYLRSVGLFDERFFMYYEDTDLAWRGRARGFRYRYVPTSLVRHAHAATSVEGSPLFIHFVERNRLLMLTKNAPESLVAKAWLSHLTATASYARRDVLGPLLHLRRPSPELVVRRLRAFAAALRLTPRMLRDRRKNRRAQIVRDAELMAWMVPQPRLSA
ncbi:MAG: hypothetical protein KatS3mg008_2130 [Acidimicrobiales bacterium]|nr:MAG: hypothetical protein KatS3mg008_2130 [Acidimicrobiales bacterium]